MSQRVAIVIGGASGIGWASAKALADDGCRIVVADRDAGDVGDVVARAGSSAAHDARRRKRSAAST